jgi:hypothetical protein
MRVGITEFGLSGGNAFVHPYSDTFNQNVSDTFPKLGRFQQHHPASKKREYIELNFEILIYDQNV